MSEQHPDAGVRPRVAPLYAAGFTTAFGAHGIAAGLGAEAGSLGIGLAVFGLMLAVYDVAEVILKPLFGALSDRIGIKPVIVGGLIAFTIASAAGILASGVVALALVRLAQGSAAAAFSPAASAGVARLGAGSSLGGYFGRYGSWKGLGYAGGPLLGAGLIALGGLPALFAALTVVGAVSTIWVAVAVPSIPVLPRTRYTVLDLVRQTTQRDFLLPTLALASATGALGVAVGFLPLLASRAGLPTIVAMGAVSVLAVASSLVQPAVGRMRDAGRVSPGPAVGLGLGLTAVALIALALAPLVMGAPGSAFASPFGSSMETSSTGAGSGTDLGLFVALLFASALVLGVGIGATTVIGFAHLARTTPPERVGRTMGTAELGREVGDAGGPLLVGGIAAIAGTPLALGALAVIVAAVAVTGGLTLRDATPTPTPGVARG